MYHKPDQLDKDDDSKIGNIQFFCFLITFYIKQGHDNSKLMLIP